MHTKHGMGRLQMVTTWAVLGDAGRYPNDVATSHAFMNPHLRALINDFRSAQDSAIDYLRTSLRIPLPKSGLDWVRNGHATVLDAATLLKNSGITLDPHGYGIDVIHPQFRVDFDYGPVGQIDCFDVWRLAVHRHHLTDAEPPVGPYDDIRDWVTNAANQGELLTVPNSYDAFFQDPTLLRSQNSIGG